MYLNGEDVEGLAGFVCESPGPGDNSQQDNGKRIEEGRYPLSTQFGKKYRSVGFSTDMNEAGALKMPGVLLEHTNKRSGILIHPAHPPTLYLSSVGCLNLTRSLKADEDMNFWDSRERVVDILQSLRAFSATAFGKNDNTMIVGAWVAVDGEPG
ncbi:DUF5675 family protein [Reyranella sp.]|uniref:DUF5675 family protein n=1 Tax=Reyranella sp. TaxID=1929291 RepID=UPI003F6E7AF3